ncbi:SLBB domain-containing protein [Planctobacterium marinum]|uniref:SLBB domain-containing protein n=1 Tax=Planctobacterium marinum TaxID=1631968 RepID=UPI001E50BDDE|nr:SLBB domain-containing protein [Planctobacterium marinum]MCC2606163.1 SLBB domain-containing protein [Planctobacterium marinum]
MLEKRVLTTLFALLLGMTAFIVNAQYNQAPTAQQIEQFKRLPVQQQRILAQQLGMDYSMIQSYLSGSGAASQPNIDTTDTTVYPRGTEFDELGNPVSYEDPIARFLKIESQELKPYGYELFAGSPSTFAPATDSPVPANYLLGIGDTLEIQIYGKENKNYTLQVDREGLIVIPSMSPLNVAGLTFSEAKTFISAEISRYLLGVESHVSMGQLRSMRIFVLGEAYKPGAYTVSSLTTMTQALFLSGGVNDIASLRNIQLKRAGKTISTLDLYELLTNGNTKNDALLQPGDVVFIPTIESSVTIKGNVRRPAIYELKNNTTFAEAIKLAGGFASDAYQGEVNVQRVSDGAITQLTVSSSQMNTRVESGDVIDVSGVSDSLDSAVTLVGAVARPGPVQWYENLKLSNLIRNRKKDLLAEVDLDYALILRDYQTGENLQIMQFQPAKLLAGDSNHDFRLSKEDIIVFFSQVESTSLGDEDIQSLALTKSGLKDKEKQAWKERIEERLFWQQIGFNYQAAELEELESEEDTLNPTNSTEPLIRLTQLEMENLGKFHDATAYSRTRLLAPIIEKLRIHASFERPLKLVEISGSVQYPGLYPLPDNGNLSDVFLAAGGLSESAFSQQSEITRYNQTESGDLQVNNIQFSPQRVVAGEVQFDLQSRDRINVFRNPEWQEQLSVELRGEVTFPGTYTISRGETLSSVLARAGGLTQYADPNASVFLRKSLRLQEAENLRRLTEDLRKEIASESLRKDSGAGSLVSYSEIQKLLRDLTSVKALGRLVIDLPKVMASQARDIALEDDDVLVVPGLNNTVNVIGEVYVPTSHLYEDDASYTAYINQSGGFKGFADKERTYIIKANGSVVIPDSDGFWYQSSGKKDFAVNPGDTIVVPFDSSHVDNLTLWTSASQIMYQFAVTIAAVGSL